MTEARESFACFGSTCSVLVGGAGGDELAGAARALLLAWHDRFTRFDPGSELSRLNADRRTIPVTAMMARLAAAVADAALITGGLVDGTLLDEVEAAGYRADLAAPLDLPMALTLAPPRRPAAPRAPVLRLSIDFSALVLCRPPGLRIDGGGIAKGLFADVVAETLGDRTFAIDCAGHVRVGGQPAAAAGWTGAASRRTTCSTRPPDAPRSRASCRRPPSPPPRSKPRRAPRRRCSAAPTTRPPGCRTAASSCSTTKVT